MKARLLYHTGFMEVIWVSDYDEEYTVIYYSLESICNLSVTAHILYFRDEDIIMFYSLINLMCVVGRECVHAHVCV
jgi:hypothetical protein